MASEACEWFDIDDDEFDNSSEREFVHALRLLARSWAKLGLEPEDAFVVRDPGLVLLVDVCAPSETYILRTLRVEFDTVSVRMGDDETGQGGGLSGKIVTLKSRSRTPSELGTLAAEWIEQELRRPIERREWTRADFRHRRWVLADSGEALTWSDSHNENRKGLGTPDSVVLVRGFR